MTHTGWRVPSLTLARSPALEKRPLTHATPTPPSRDRTKPGRVRPGPDAPVRDRPRDRPVRVHLQRLRDDHERDPRGRPERHGLHLRRGALEGPERPCP